MRRFSIRDLFWLTLVVALLLVLLGWWVSYGRGVKQRFTIEPPAQFQPPPKP